MTELIKIGFTGTRYGLNSDQKVQIISILDKYDNLIVSHGDCIANKEDFYTKIFFICVIGGERPLEEVEI